MPLPPADTSVTHHHTSRHLTAPCASTRASGCLVDAAATAASLPSVSSTPEVGFLRVIAPRPPEDDHDDDTTTTTRAKPNSYSTARARHVPQFVTPPCGTPARRSEGMPAGWWSWPVLAAGCVVCELHVCVRRRTAGAVVVITQQRCRLRQQQSSREWQLWVAAAAGDATHNKRQQLSQQRHR
mgnify:CR=1 FL=1